MTVVVATVIFCLWWINPALRNLANLLLIWRVWLSLATFLWIMVYFIGLAIGAKQITGAILLIVVTLAVIAVFVAWRRQQQPPPFQRQPLPAHQQP